MSFVDHLNKISQIYEYTKAQDEYGQEEKTWIIKEADVPTRYRRLKGKEVTSGAQSYTLTVEDFVFWYEPDKDIVKNNRIEVDGKQFKVITYEMDSSQHHKRVYGRKVKV